MGELLWMAGKAFLIAIVLTPIVRDIFRSYNMVDRPGKRKIHTYPIPRVGGIAIAIAYGVAAKEARTAGKSLADHASHLVVHGVLHLLGFDHVTVRQAKVMEPMETKILKTLNVADPYRRGAI